jgi:Ran GTPase-activating protein (RanGAP) involved in mRNA processing and transport
VRLDLSDNPMTEGVAEALAACLAQQPHLQHLNLNDTGEAAGVHEWLDELAATGSCGAHVVRGCEVENPWRCPLGQQFTSCCNFVVV